MLVVASTQKLPTSVRTSLEKSKHGIPEDHPLNPATIADNVGDNVGDVAGMGADLFESYVGAIVGAMVIGATLMVMPEFKRLSGRTRPDRSALLLSAVGVVASVLGTFFVRVSEGGIHRRR